MTRQAAIILHLSQCYVTVILPELNTPSRKQVHWQRLSPFESTGVPGFQPDIHLYCQYGCAYWGKTAQINIKDILNYCHCVGIRIFFLTTNWKCSHLCSTSSLLLQVRESQKSNVTLMGWKFLELSDCELFSARPLESCLVWLEVKWAVYHTKCSFLLSKFSTFQGKNTTNIPSYIPLQHVQKSLLLNFSSYIAASIKREK